MEGLWLDQNLTVIADSVYANKIGGEQELVAKDVEISLPEVKNLTIEAKAMGNMNVPIIAQFDNMEATIHHIGVDLGLAKMLAQETLELEVRWVDQVMMQGGGQTAVSCKAFLTGFPQGIPQIGVKPGEAVDVETPYIITGYTLKRGEDELWSINRLSQTCVINGVDYFADISSML